MTKAEGMDAPVGFSISRVITAKLLLDHWCAVLGRLLSLGLTPDG